jgi:hypothetical protein
MLKNDEKKGKMKNRNRAAKLAKAAEAYLRPQDATF